jgi:O-acetylserine/cysteine efflux transporter
MKSTHRSALLALCIAGTFWGLTVPLSKLALGWLAPAWLAAVRFLIAAPILALIGRRGLRAAVTPMVLATGTAGYGAVILLSNAAIERTSVSHAAVIGGVVPMLVALIAAGTRRDRTSPAAWAGYGIALLGVVLIAAGSGGGATAGGDALMLVSAVLSAVFIFIQPRVLAGRDAAAVTAVQFAGGALLALPLALLREGVPAAPHAAGPVIAFAALIVAGTLLPYWLFARGQAQVSAQLAGAFVNLEPLVGAAIGWVAFGNAAGTPQLLGATAVLLGIILSALPPQTTDRARERLALAWGR